MGEVQRHVKTTFGEAEAQLEQRSAKIGAKHQQLKARGERRRVGEEAKPEAGAPAAAPAAA
eukprot:9493459-Pyramimonas_sp.AAC.1